MNIRVGITKEIVSPSNLGVKPALPRGARLESEKINDGRGRLQLDVTVYHSTRFVRWLSQSNSPALGCMIRTMRQGPEVA